jgi:site-specific DNA recombinase
VQDLLAERGDDHAGQVANRSDYDLAGLIKCTHCGKRYIGNAANGRGGRYRYYTCFSRQRYGIAACNADRLRADQLEGAIRDALLATYRRGDLFHQAVIQAKLQQTSQAIDRYLDAFEQGTMPEDLCRPRLQKPSTQRDQLRARERQLRALLASDTTAAPRPGGATTTCSPGATGQPARPCCGP